MVDKAFPAFRAFVGDKSAIYPFHVPNKFQFAGFAKTADINDVPSKAYSPI